ncbi:unnamed protein product [Linum trigynum]|uniref:SPARK domain-containing protein n=1 Tax=Linum trigynum TaxID=586398 RepID=A0AAV2CGS1_9ROSI
MTCESEIATAVAQNDTTEPCQLDFSVLRNLVENAKIPTVDRTQACQYLRQGLRLVQSDYLRRTNDFLLPNPTGALTSASSTTSSRSRTLTPAPPVVSVPVGSHNASNLVTLLTRAHLYNQKTLPSKS